jgi:hypothetical protein
MNVRLRPVPRQATTDHPRSFACTLIWTSQRRFRAESGPWSNVRLEKLTGAPAW